MKFLEIMEAELGEVFKQIHPVTFSHAMILLMETLSKEDPVVCQLLLREMFFSLQALYIGRISADRKLAIAGSVLERYFSEMGDFKKMADTHQKIVVDNGKLIMLRGAEQLSKKLIDSYRAAK